MKRWALALCVLRTCASTSTWVDSACEGYALVDNVDTVQTGPGLRDVAWDAIYGANDEAGSDVVDADPSATCDEKHWCSGEKDQCDDRELKEQCPCTCPSVGPEPMLIKVAQAEVTPEKTEDSSASGQAAELISKMEGDTEVDKEDLLAKLQTEETEALDADELDDPEALAVEDAKREAGESDVSAVDAIREAARKAFMAGKSPDEAATDAVQAVKAVEATVTSTDEAIEEGIDILGFTDTQKWIQDERTKAKHNTEETEPLQEKSEARAELERTTADSTQLSNEDSENSVDEDSEVPHLVADDLIIDPPFEETSSEQLQEEDKARAEAEEETVDSTQVSDEDSDDPEDEDFHSEVAEKDTTEHERVSEELQDEKVAAHEEAEKNTVDKEVEKSTADSLQLGRKDSEAPKDEDVHSEVPEKAEAISDTDEQELAAEGTLPSGKEAQDQFMADMAAEAADRRAKHAAELKSAEAAVDSAIAVEQKARAEHKDAEQKARAAAKAKYHEERFTRGSQADATKEAERNAEAQARQRAESAKHMEDQKLAEERALLKVAMEYERRKQKARYEAEREISRQARLAAAETERAQATLEMKQAKLQASAAAASAAAKDLIRATDSIGSADADSDLDKDDDDNDDNLIEQDDDELKPKFNGAGGAVLMSVASKENVASQMAADQKDEQSVSIDFPIEFQDDWSESLLKAFFVKSGIRRLSDLDKSYVLDTEGLRRDVVITSKQPPWMTKVDDMSFPVTLKLFKANRQASPLGQSASEDSAAVQTPEAPPPAERKSTEDTVEVQAAKAPHLTEDTNGEDAVAVQTPQASLLGEGTGTEDAVDVEETLRPSVETPLPAETEEVAQPIPAIPFARWAAKAAEMEA